MLKPRFEGRVPLMQENFRRHQSAGGTNVTRFNSDPNERGGEGQNRTNFTPPLPFFVSRGLKATKFRFLVQKY